METKFEIIETDDYVLAVSSEEIKKGDWCLSTDKNFIIKLVNLPAFSCDKKIIAYQPKGNAPELEGILEILVEDDVEKLAEEYVNDNYPDYLDLKERAAAIEDVIWGYKAATKVYSEEDMIAFSIWRGTTNTKDFHNCKNPREQFQLWKTLKQPKTPKWFVAEPKIEYTEDGLDYQSDELKTKTINGKTYLKGKFTNK